MSYLLKFKLLADCQFAYQKGKSVVLAIYHFLNTVYECIEKSSHVIAILNDFSKAFDCLLTTSVEGKCIDLGILNNPLSIITSCMTDRPLNVYLSFTDKISNTVKTIKSKTVI